VNPTLARAITTTLRAANAPLTTHQLFLAIPEAENPGEISRTIYQLRKLGTVAPGPPRAPGEPGVFEGRGEKPRATYLLAELQKETPMQIAEADHTLPPAYTPSVTAALDPQDVDPLLESIVHLRGPDPWPDAVRDARRLRALADCGLLAEEVDLGLWLHALADRIAQEAGQ
jgi:hypothetical protein